MGGLVQDVDPAEAGFDAARLARADRMLDRYVDAGRLAGWQLLVTRDGAVVRLSSSGRRHQENDLPVETDTLWRIYSMTKPITSVATLMLYEEGAFELTDPVSRYLPSFADMRIYIGGSDLKPVTVPAQEPIRIWHLLTHTAGLTYGFHRTHPVDAMLRAKGYEWGAPAGIDLATAVDQWAGLPLLFEPGAEWNYSLATDVLGRLVEVVSGTTLDDFFATRIFGPLGMVDTAFHVPADQQHRLARLYLNMPSGGLAAGDQLGDFVLDRPSLLSGGGGLVSTTADYHRFTQLLLREGELDGVRLLGSRTVRYMARNHLPGGALLDQIGRPIHAETPQRGVGFGLGVATIEDPATFRTLSNAGEYHWGGAASTTFWVDPVDRITVVFMTQLMPSSTLPIRTQLRQLVYQALVD